MANYEKEIVLPRGHEFQALPGYREWERTPFVVARQTHTLLGLYYQGAIHRPGLARDYLHDYALTYLKDAEKGSDALYDETGVLIENIDLEVREAADHAFVAFAHIPDFVTSPWLPKGYSRRGELQPPQTRNEFLKRITELQVGLWQVVAGEMEPRATFEAYPSLARTYGFFRVGSELPIKLSEDERKQDQREREKFNDLLTGVDVSL